MNSNLNNDSFEDDPLSADEKVRDRSSKWKTLRTMYDRWMPQNPVVRRVLIAVLLLAVAMAIAITVLMVDANRATIDNLGLQHLFLDVSQELPVAQMKLQYSFEGTKWSRVDLPKTVSCDLESGPIHISIQESTMDSKYYRETANVIENKKSSFSYCDVEVTIPKDHTMSHAEFAWDLLLKRQDDIGPYKCTMKVKVHLGGFLPFRKTVNLEKRKRGYKVVTAPVQVKEEGSPESVQPTSAPTNGIGSVLAATTHSPEPYVFSMNDQESQPILPETSPPMKEEDAPDLSIFQVRQLNMDTLELGILAKLPSFVFEIAPIIHLVLPPMNITITPMLRSDYFTKLSESSQVELEGLDVVFRADQQHSGEYVSLRVTNSDDDSTWYSPFLDIATIEQKIYFLGIEVECNESFLELMLGKSNNWLVHKYGWETYQRQRDLLQKQFASRYGMEDRDLYDQEDEADSNGSFECMDVRDSRSNFLVRWCTEWDVDGKVSVDFYFRFEDFFLSTLAAVDWQELDGSPDGFTVSTNASMIVEETDQVDLTGELRVEWEDKDLSVKFQVGNEGRFYPFSVAMDCNGSSVDDVWGLTLNQASVVFEGIQELDATGSASINLDEEQLYIFLNDDRILLDISAAHEDSRPQSDYSDRLSATWTLAFDGESIAAGFADIDYRSPHESIHAMMEINDFDLDIGISGSGNCSWQTADQFTAGIPSFILRKGSDTYFDINSDLLVEYNDQVSDNQRGYRSGLKVAVFVENTGEIAPLALSSEGEIHFQYADFEGDFLGGNIQFLRFEWGQELHIDANGYLDIDYSREQATLYLQNLAKKEMDCLGSVSWDTSSIFASDSSLELNFDRELYIQSNASVLIEEVFGDNLHDITGLIEATSAPYAKLQLTAGSGFAWRNMIDALDAYIDRFQLGWEDTTYMDASGEMYVDLVADEFTFALKDNNMDTDGYGFDISVSGSLDENDIVMGTIDRFYVLWDYNPEFDVDGTLVLNITEPSLGFAMKDSIHGWSVEMDKGTVTLGGDDYLIEASVSNMTVVVENNRWADGSMYFLLTDSEVQMSMSSGEGKSQEPKPEIATPFSNATDSVSINPTGIVSVAPSDPAVSIAPTVSASTSKAPTMSPSSESTTDKEDVVSANNDTAAPTEAPSAASRFSQCWGILIALALSYCTTF